MLTILYNNSWCGLAIANQIVQPYKFLKKAQKMIDCERKIKYNIRRLAIANHKNYKHISEKGAYDEPT